MLSNGMEAKVSDVDYPRLRRHTWWSNYHKATDKHYAYMQVGRTTIYMHRMITDAPPGFHVDHRNGESLDNQRPNLRVTSPKSNRLNTSGFGMSGYKGVSMKGRRWRARIQLDGEEQVIGYFDCRVEAAKAYDRRAVELFGEFAWLNFPEDFQFPPHDFEPEPPIPF